MCRSNGTWLPKRGEHAGAFGQYYRAITFGVVPDYDPEGQAHSVVCPELPGCASASDAVEQAKQNIREVIARYVSPSEVALPRDGRLDEVTVR